MTIHFSTYNSSCGLNDYQRSYTRYSGGDVGNPLLFAGIGMDVFGAISGNDDMTRIGNTLLGAGFLANMFDSNVYHTEYHERNYGNHTYLADNWYSGSSSFLHDNYNYSPWLGHHRHHRHHGHHHHHHHHNRYGSGSDFADWVLRGY